MIKFLELKDLNSTERYWVYEGLGSELNNNYIEDGITYEFTYDVLDYKVEVVYKTEFDVETEEDHVEVEYYIKKFDLEKLFKEHNVKFEESNSGSVYFEKNGKEYRVADHGRPSYNHGGVWYDHEYENDIRFNDVEERYYIIKKILEV